MPLFYVHECSRCKRREESKSVERPAGWVDACITSKSKTYHNDDTQETFLWCSYCWNSMKEVKVIKPGTIGPCVELRLDV